MEVRLDEKVTNEKNRALGIEVGDFVSFDPRTIVTDTSFIKSRHLDDKGECGDSVKSSAHLQEEQINCQ